MKKLLIISPYFPPANTPDMQRVRMSLPYFKQFGWQSEVVVVNSRYTDTQKDELLLQTIPDDVKIHTINALDKKWTSKIGFGSLGFRAFRAYYKKVNSLLAQGKYDLIYFSTTQFPVCVLGRYWKMRFGVPYVIDMQDPWFSDYYKDKPKSQQPPKYKMVYTLHKKLEALTMAKVDGLISVSENYITALKDRYIQIKDIPAATITFAAFKPDFDIALSNEANFDNLLLSGFKNIVYTGRGGVDMHKAIAPLFIALSRLRTKQPQKFNNIRLYFIGTSYAPKGHGVPSILPLADMYGVQENVIEIPDRISYFNALAILHHADALFIPGSDDPNYTASKIFPYMLSNKPLLTIFNSKSPAIAMFDEYGAAHNYSYDATSNIIDAVSNFLTAVAEDKLPAPAYDERCMEKYSALTMTSKECRLFDEVLSNVKKNAASSRLSK